MPVSRSSNSDKGSQETNQWNIVRAVCTDMTSDGSPVPEATSRAWDESQIGRDHKQALNTFLRNPLPKDSTTGKFCRVVCTSSYVDENGREVTFSEPVDIMQEPWDPAVGPSEEEVIKRAKQIMEMRREQRQRAAKGQGKSAGTDGTGTDGTGSAPHTDRSSSNQRTVDASVMPGRRAEEDSAGKSARSDGDGADSHAKRPKSDHQPRTELGARAAKILESAKMKLDDDSDALFEAVTQIFFLGTGSFKGTKNEAIFFGKFVLQMLDNGMAPIIGGTTQLFMLPDGRIGLGSVPDGHVEDNEHATTLVNQLAKLEGAGDVCADEPDPLGFFSMSGPMTFGGKPITTAIARVLNRFVTQGARDMTTKDSAPSSSSAAASSREQPTEPSEPSGKTMRRRRRKELMKEKKSQEATSTANAETGNTPGNQDSEPSPTSSHFLDGMD